MALGENVPAAEIGTTIFEPSNVPPPHPQVSTIQGYAQQEVADTLGEATSSPEYQSAKAELQEFLAQLMSNSKKLSRTDTVHVAQQIAKICSDNDVYEASTVITLINALGFEKIIIEALKHLKTLPNNSGKPLQTSTNSSEKPLQYLTKPPEEELENFLEKFNKGEPPNQIISYLQGLAADYDLNLETWLSDKIIEQIVRAFSNCLRTLTTNQVKQEQNRMFSRICTDYFNDTDLGGPNANDKFSQLLAKIDAATNFVTNQSLDPAITSQLLRRFGHNIPEDFTRILSNFLRKREKNPTNSPFRGFSLDVTLAHPSSSNEHLAAYVEMLADWNQTETPEIRELPPEERPATYAETLRYVFNFDDNMTLEEMETYLSQYFTTAVKTIEGLSKNFYGNKTPKLVEIIPQIREANSFRTLLTYLCDPYSCIPKDDPKRIHTGAQIRLQARLVLEVALKARSIAASPQFAQLEKNTEALEEQFWSKYLKDIKPITIRYQKTTNGIKICENGDKEIQLYEGTLAGRTKPSGPIEKIQVLFYNPTKARVLSEKSIDAALSKGIIENIAFATDITDLVRCSFIAKNSEDLEKLQTMLGIIATTDGAETKGKRTNGNTSNKFSNTKLRPHIAVALDDLRMYAGPMEIQIFNLQSALEAMTKEGCASHDDYVRRRSETILTKLFPPPLYKKLYGIGRDINGNAIYVLNPNPTAEPLAA